MEILSQRLLRFIFFAFRAEVGLPMYICIIASFVGNLSEGIAWVRKDRWGAFAAPPSDSAGD